MPIKDLTGKRFGKLIVIKRNLEAQKSSGRRDCFWDCKCDCGNEVTMISFSLQKAKSCGYCDKRDFIGRRFGKLTVVAFDHLPRYPNKKYGTESYYKCLCDCGNTTVVARHHLTSGHTKSCGCLLSKGEVNIAKILKDNNINYTKEQTFEDLKGIRGGLLRYDFSILNKDGQIIRLIEFDGPHHTNQKVHEHLMRKNDNTFEELQMHDNKKNQYALSHGIPLVRIPYEHRRKITLEKIMGNQFLIKNKEE